MGKNEEAAVVMFMLDMDRWIAKLKDQTQDVRGPVCEFMEWFKEYLRLRVEDAYLRVWDIECSVSRQYIERLLAARGLTLKVDPSAMGNDQSADKRQDTLENDKIKIEEYANRLRVHTWRSPPQFWGSTPVRGSALYDWVDLGRDVHMWEPYDEMEFPLWQWGLPLESETEEFCDLRLTLSGEMARLMSEDRRSSGEMSRHLQLTLWIYQRSRRGFVPNDLEYLLKYPDDVLFRVPLEPDLLGNHEASPYDEPGKICFDPKGSWGRVAWAYHAKVDEVLQWHWCLSLFVPEPGFLASASLP